ncbi:MAG TPA: hypothetical protein VFS06_01025 [Casimicrobiaceae bacterium]|nr:hypothetical protein [Casimicrobiaceae bacterium]
MATQWGSTKGIRDALKKAKRCDEKFFEGLSAFTQSHLTALRGLTADELARMCGGQQGVLTVGWILEGAVTSDRKLAVKLVDALAQPKAARHLQRRTANAMLLAAQDAVTRQGRDPDRLRRAIDAAAPHGERDADIYVTAACCAAELGANDEALAFLEKAKRGKSKELKKARSNPAFKALAKHPRFLAVFGQKPPKAAPKKLVPVKMSNTKAIAALRAFCKNAESPQLGDTWPSAPKETNVEFWFANKSKAANQHFQQFASTGDGSLLALWKVRKATWDNAPVVFLGSEGDLEILGGNVADTIALLARCGDEVLDMAIAYGCDPPDPNPTTAWVESTFGRSITQQPKAIAAAAGKKYGLATLKKLTRQLGGLE